MKKDGFVKFQAVLFGLLMLAGFAYFIYLPLTYFIDGREIADATRFGWEKVLGYLESKPDFSAMVNDFLKDVFLIKLSAFEGVELYFMEGVGILMAVITLLKPLLLLLAFILYFAKAFGKNKLGTKGLKVAVGLVLISEFPKIFLIFQNSLPEFAAELFDGKFMFYLQNYYEFGIVAIFLIECYLLAHVNTETKEESKIRSRNAFFRFLLALLSTAFFFFVGYGGFAVGTLKRALCVLSMVLVVGVQFSRSFYNGGRRVLDFFTVVLMGVWLGLTAPFVFTAEINWIYVAELCGTFVLYFVLTIVRSASVSGALSKVSMNEKDVKAFFKGKKTEEYDRKPLAVKKGAPLLRPFFDLLFVLLVALFFTGIVIGVWYLAGWLLGLFAPESAFRFTELFVLLTAIALFALLPFIFRKKADNLTFGYGVQKGVYPIYVHTLLLGAAVGATVWYAITYGAFLSLFVAGNELYRFIFYAAVLFDLAELCLILTFVKNTCLTCGFLNTRYMREDGEYRCECCGKKKYDRVIYEYNEEQNIIKELLASEKNGTKTSANKSAKA